MFINTDRFLDMAQLLAGTTLQTTGRQKLFTVNVRDGKVFYTPLETGQERNSSSRNTIDRIIERYKETLSFRPSDYHDISFNSSYHVVILKAIMQA